jgi:protein gp37
MSDLFHERIGDNFISRVAGVMQLASWHTYQVLTKRPERMKHLLTGELRQAACASHIWWGVTVENRRHGLPRIDLLRECGAAVSFLSIEPLLEDLGQIDLSGIDWVIVGGESGPGARPMREEWVQSLRAQCAEAGIPFFFKQWGGVQKSRFGRKLGGRTWDEFPEIDTRPEPSAAERRRVIAKANRLLALPGSDTWHAGIG